MIIMRVFLVELLHQATMGRIPALEYMLSVHVGSRDHILSCQALSAAAS
jgi:hypothetical protein